MSYLLLKNKTEHISLSELLYELCEADQHLCFRYTDSTIPLLSKSTTASVTVQASLYRTCLETTLLVFSSCGSYVVVLQFMSFMLGPYTASI